MSDSKGDKGAGRFSMFNPFQKRNDQRTQKSIDVFNKIRGSEGTPEATPEILQAAADIRYYLTNNPTIGAIHKQLNGASYGNPYYGTAFGDCMLGSILYLEKTIDDYLKSSPDTTEPYAQALTSLQHVLQKIFTFSTEWKPDRVRKLIEAVQMLLNAPLPKDTSNDALMRNIHTALYYTLAMTDISIKDLAKNASPSVQFMIKSIINVDKICHLISGNKTEDSAAQQDESALQKLALKDQTLNNRMMKNEVRGPGANDPSSHHNP